MPLLKTPAITLKSRKWGEADRIVTFYTLRYGKVRGAARGARRMKSRFGSALEPFVHADLNLFEKPNDTMHRVSQADIKDSFSGLREDLALMAAAGRLANLVGALTADGDPSPRLFETLLEGLRTLHEKWQEPGLAALLFQIKLLALAGFRPQLDHCAACGKAAAAGSVGRELRFSAYAGGLVCPSCSGNRPDRGLALSLGGLALLQQASRLAPELLPRLQATGTMRRELEVMVEAYVTVVTGKRLPPVDFLLAAEEEPVYGR